MKKNNEILIEFDGKFVNQQNFLYIQQMSSILKENKIENNSEFELDIFKITTSKVKTYEKNN